VAPLVVAVLETMWGSVNGRAPRAFHINPHNYSGRRLYKFVGSGARLLVTNACRELVNSARRHGKPDSQWLAANLRRLEPIRVLLVCGKVAQKAFKDSGHPTNARVFYLAHPAARNWTKAKLRETERRVQQALS